MSNKYYFGIDLGGTFIKAGVVDQNGNIIADDKSETKSELGNIAVIDNICTLFNKVLKDSKIDKSDIVGVGVGAPGLIDTEKGIAIISHNLKFDNFEIASILSKKIGLPVKVANDANVATLAETLYGAGKGYNNVVLITLGTGVGGGAVVNGKLMLGTHGYGAEFGHTVVEYNGRICSCGRRGCLEAYCSATALIKQTKLAMKKNKQSKMWQICDINLVDGKTPFNFMQTDLTAKKIIDSYIDYLACGLTNIANVFRPEVILLSGGIANQKEGLYDNLNQKLIQQIFGNENVETIKILPANLKNKAGILGAAALFFN
ncbi:MAG: ROK family protein [Clostridia bacterium]|nr:ROK family protein [Clostridia bacterium]